MAAKSEKLASLRKDVDRLDRELLALLNERARVVKQVSAEKGRTGLPLFDPTREKRVVEKLQKLNRGPLASTDVALVMDAIFKVYRSLDKPLQIAHFGPAGTFAHQAALRQFGERNVYLPCKTVEYVFREVEKASADYGVVPIENSNEGIVSHTLDMFVNSDLSINAEIILEIHHYLLSREKSLSRVSKVYSHYQPLGQCRKWLEEHLMSATLVEAESTAEAVQKSKTTGGSAAIGAAIAARIYGMNILAEKIEDFRENVTRFLVIGRGAPQKSGRDKTSILFSVKDRIGALHDMLVPFKKDNINLTRIESRPTKRKAWEYVFFVDLLGHRDDEKVRRALRELEKQCSYLKILGSYPIG